ncbi:hypothetical protein EDB81DRAFT_285274 [Dactylonectria macrodidyma]|uniref:Fe2OG dioxygenase domain-containing protein n=1 Tax=Dactylonectria macrodidyma TaxID=307937 RepID=A0A9P9FN78_9HYPO|nr:hypothetical protein EDB81DRAFT_285274 [Dactylonectria macrodidyma]
MPKSNHSSASVPRSEGSSAQSSSERDTNANPDILLLNVSSALKDHAGKDVFAIGGKLDVFPASPPKDTSDASVVVRWDSGEPSHCRNVQLPVGDDAVSKGAFAQLLTDCEPATFGIGNKEVLDETYRKASKMDATRFSTDFHPYEHGILDTIVQALAHGDRQTTSNNLGIRAELYKLNIYSGPSGKFKPHVDTPRSAEQMGSLVVCLPHEHQGGQLAVRHGGREIVFNWADAKAPSIQWAAFFSDCEHEVFEVTKGHRLTLTYNLFWTSYGPALMANSLGTLDQESFHFFGTLKSLLDCPTFLPRGGLLGFTCTHAYPHTSGSSMDNLHHMLKGLDMMVYQALRQLTGAAKITTVLDEQDYKDNISEGQYTYQVKASLDIESDDDEGLHESHALIAKSLRPVVLSDDHDYESETLNPAEIPVSHRNSDPMYPRRVVTWLNYAPNSRTYKELAVAFITYGNQPGIDAYYSSAVIIAEVPEMDTDPA